MSDILTVEFDKLFVNDPAMAAFAGGEMSWADFAGATDPEFYNDVPVSPPTTDAATTAALEAVTTAALEVAAIDDGFQLVKRKSTNNLKTIVCRNLHRDSTREELRKIFEQFGPTRDVYVPVDKSTGNIRGFGFIEFIKADDAQHAYDSQAGKLVIRKRNITVEFKAAN